MEEQEIILSRLSRTFQFVPDAEACLYINEKIKEFETKIVHAEKILHRMGESHDISLQDELTETVSHLCKLYDTIRVLFMNLRFETSQ